MQQYLHNPVGAETQLPSAYNSNIQIGYPIIQQAAAANRTQARKVMQTNTNNNKHMISADYTMNVAQSHNVSQISSGLVKNNNSSRNFVNFTEQNNSNN